VESGDKKAVNFRITSEDENNCVLHNDNIHCDNGTEDVYFSWTYKPKETSTSTPTPYSLFTDIFIIFNRL
jgi:hypothetical protein